MKKVPEGSVRVKCESCRKFHIVRVGKYYICPKTIESCTKWYIVAFSKDDVKQTSHFENVKVWLNLES